MTKVLWDSWAFLECALDGPRCPDVEALLDDADAIVTTQHVVAECFTFLARSAGSTRPALAWWNDLRASRVRVMEPSLDEVHAYATGLKQIGSLSFTDLTLGAISKTAGTRVAATADREFRRMRLEPVFAKT